MTRLAGMAALALVVATGARAAEPPGRHLESQRLRAAAVYLATVTEVRRVAPLEDLDREAAGQMEATLKVTKVFRAPAGTAAPAETVVRYDSRAPEPEEDPYYALAAGETVLVFAGSFGKEYAVEMFHGAPAALNETIGALRAYVAAMDASTLRLHGLTPATRAGALRLYDAVLAALGKPK